MLCEWVGVAPCVGAATESLDDDVDGREGGRGHHHPHPDGGSGFASALELSREVVAVVCAYRVAAVLGRVVGVGGRGDPRRLPLAYRS
jgi:hypothetical protein